MKIAFFNRSMGKGGAEKMLSFVIDSISTIADRIVLIQYSSEKDGYSYPSNVIHESVMLDDGTNQNIFSKITHLLIRIYQLRKLLLKYKIEVLCTFGYYYTMMGVIATMGTSVKILASERRSPQDNKWPWTFLSKWIYGNCDRVVFQLDQARNYYTNLSDDQTDVIPNPYIPNTTDIVYDYHHTRPEIVMAASRLEYVKGFDVGIKAMSIVIKTHPEYKLVIYGSGDFYNKYGDLISQLGISEYVIYKGHSQTILQEIVTSRIFLLPSRVEGIPNMLIEAMGMGMPSIAADCTPGGARLLIGDNNEFGQLVPVGDEVSTAAAIIRYIEDYDYLIEKSTCAKQVKQRFLVKDISEKWVENFKVLM